MSICEQCEKAEECSLGKDRLVDYGIADVARCDCFQPMKIKIKPCPFCGRMPDVWFTYGDIFAIWDGAIRGEDGHWYIHCMECDVVMKGGYGLERLADVWNRRA